MSKKQKLSNRAKRRAAEQKTKSESPLVEIHSITPPAFFVNILKDLETAGFRAPFLYGGALRDVTMGRDGDINDLDIDMPFHPTMQGTEFNNKNLNAFIKNTFKHLRQIPNIDKMEYHRTVRDKKSKNPTALRIDLYGYGHVIALYITPPSKKRLSKKAFSADAPINAVYMGSNGQIVAHRDFENHARERVFKALTDNQPLRRLFNRYLHLADKIPGLTYDGPAYNPANNNNKHGDHHTSKATKDKRNAYRQQHRRGNHGPR